MIWRQPLAVAALAGAAVLVPAATGGADSFTPISMQVHVTPVARRNVPLKTTVTVIADPGVLDTSEGVMRVEVKLAGECGGDFQTTPGDTLVNASLTPAPQTGRAYTGSATGAGRPTAFGQQTLCVFLEDTDIGRVYANDESGSVNVSKPCTTTASRYDSAEKSLARAQKQLRRTNKKAKARRRQLQRTIAKRRRTANTHRLSARAACGAGVTL